MERTVEMVVRFECMYTDLRGADWIVVFAHALNCTYGETDHKPNIAIFPRVGM